MTYSEQSVREALRTVIDQRGLLPKYIITLAEAGLELKGKPLRLQCEYISKRLPDSLRVARFTLNNFIERG